MSVAAKTLPHNHDAEQSILGGVLIKPELVDRLDALEVDDFYDLRHKVVWTAILNVISSGTPLDIVTLQTEIERIGKLDALGGVAYLGELVVRVPTPDNVVEYAKVVRSAALVRRVAIAADDLVARARKWTDEPDELIAQAQRTFEDLGKRHVEAQQSVRLIDVGRALEDLEQLARAPVYPTPFETLNNALGFGGLLGTQVYTVAAGTGRGKTSWVGEVASFQALKTEVIVATYEMTPGYIVARVAGGRLGLHSNAIIRGEVAMSKVMATVPYARLFFMHRPTLKDIRIAALRSRAKRGVAPLIVVDYIQKLAEEIMRTQTRPDSRLATAEASASLCEIAEESGAAILSVSATSRMSSRRTLDPRKLKPYELVDVAKESGAVEYDGAGLIVLSLSDQVDGDERIATMTVAKARFGEEMHIDARFNGRRGMWRDLGQVGEPITPIESASDLRAKILRAVTNNPAKSKTDIFRRVGGQKQRVFEEVDALLQEAVLAHTSAGLAIVGGEP